MQIQIKLLICMCVVVIINSSCQAYVVYTTSNAEQHVNPNDNSEEQQQQQRQPSHVIAYDNINLSQQLDEEAERENTVIERIVKPSEIRVPLNAQEIVNVVGKESLPKLENDNNKIDKTEKEEKQRRQQQQHTLTYSELATLLAFWQWAKEHNFYETEDHTNNYYNRIDNKIK